MGGVRNCAFSVDQLTSFGQVDQEFSSAGTARRFSGVTDSNEDEKLYLHAVLSEQVPGDNHPALDTRKQNPYKFLSEQIPGDNHPALDTRKQNPYTRVPAQAVGSLKAKQ